MVNGLMGCAAACGLLLSNHGVGDEIQGQLGRSIAQISAGGVSNYAPNKWGILQIRLANPTEAPVEFLAATYFEDEPTLQFGRRVWVPPKSRIQTWSPILPPPVASNEGKRFNFRTLVMDASRDREVMIRSDSGYLQVDGTLRAVGTSPVTGIIDTLDESVTENTDAAHELVVAARSAEQFERHLAVLSDQILPAGEAGLHVLDQLVIADGRIVGDLAGLASIRRWLFGGGHLWVMLDRVDPRVLELLLGDEFVCQVVDRVGLTTVRIEPATDKRNTERSTAEYEQPVELVRVMVSGANVEFTVDGWPAAITKRCGDGHLLVTTLGPQGWMRLRTAADDVRRPPMPMPGQPSPSAPFNLPVPPVSVESSGKARFVPLGPTASLMAEFFQPRPATLLPESKVEPQVQKYIGYSLPPRWLVLSLLVGFSVVLAALGVLLSRWDRLASLGTIGPVLAVTVSLVLVWLGRQQRQAVPPAVASMQFVQAVSGTDDVRVGGVVGLFSPEAGHSGISARSGGWLMPDMSGLQGTTRRMIWTDLDDWQWDNLPSPVGLRSAAFSQSRELPERLEARATFGPDGLTGRLHTGGSHSPSDAILATRDGRVGVDLRGDGTFVARADNVFAGEQFLAAGLLSDEQNRRQQTLENLLTNPQRRDFPPAPQLLFWCEPWDVGFRFDEGRRSFGAALVAVPLIVQRPPSGTEVALPSPFLPYRVTIGPDGSAPSGWFDDRNRTWAEKSWPSTTWLRFQVPPVLLPIAVQRGRVVVRVTGPVGKLEVAGQRGADIVPIKTWIDPVGSLTLDLTDTNLLHVSEDGGLILRVSGGDPDRPELTGADKGRGAKMSYWQIESLTLELHVKTIDPQGIAHDPAGGG